MIFIELGDAPHAGIASPQEQGVGVLAKPAYPASLLEMLQVLGDTWHAQHPLV